MSKLASEMCVACQVDSPLVGSAEMTELLQQLPGWQLVDERGVLHLVKTYPFSNFVKALDFANAVAELAEGANHHPAILIEWGKTTVTWWTHTIHGLHRNDFIMAAKTDFLHNK